MTFVGIDPGANGACCALAEDGTVTLLKHDGATEHDQWEWISQWIGEPCHAMIEQQTARPSRIPDREHGGWRQTVLASTVMLYGSYRDLRTMLLCAAVSFEDCPPKRWQGGLHIPPKYKGESDSSWKNKLKSKALDLFPHVKVTLWNADSLLIAEWCRRSYANTRVADNNGLLL